MKYYIIDAFTSKPFFGNPAAVVPVTQILPESRLQEIASEMNLSETAYLWPLEDVEKPWKNSSIFKLRWFTPMNEVVLCGHATLSAAHALFHEIGNKSPSIVFESLSGPLTVYREQNSIRLDFPALPGECLSLDEDKEFEPLVQAVSGSYTVLAKLYQPKTKNLMICISDDITRKEFESIKPNYDILRIHDGSKVKGIIVTTKGDFGETTNRGLDNYHFASRFFAPWIGVLEDPVSGSTHPILAPFWSEKLGLTEVKGLQCSPRSGEVFVCIKEDNRIDIIGKSVTVITGNIHC